MCVLTVRRVTLSGPSPARAVAISPASPARAETVSASPIVVTPASQEGTIWPVSATA